MRIWQSTWTLLLTGMISGVLAADDKSTNGDQSAAKPRTLTKLEIPKGLRRLGPKTQKLWIDPSRKIVVVDGEICLRRGQLEMFACPRQTKEHEAIVSVHCDARLIHAALLAVGAKAGNTVEYEPKYKPAAGSIVDIYVMWKNQQGKKQIARAQDWIKFLKTGKVMPFDWVFAGSGFWTDKQTGKRHYMASSGDLICVSNFNTAMLDLPVQSTDAAAELMFAAFTAKIPPRRTPVRLVMIPRPGFKKASATTKPAG